MSIGSLIRIMHEEFRSSRQRPSTPKPPQFKHQALYAKLGADTPEGVLSTLQSSKEGLAEADVKRLQEQYGLNEIEHERYNWLRQLLLTILNPFILLLLILSAVSYFAQDTKGMIVMSAMAFISLTLTFVQEFRSSRAAERLQAMVSTRCTVSRGEKQDIPMSELVPGDIVHMSAGDMIPADLRLLSSKDLFVSQSQLTGESIPVEKHATLLNGQPAAILDYMDLCFMGSNVVSGVSTAVVIQTGRESYLGSIANRLIGRRTKTNFDKGIAQFTRLMVRFIIVMTPTVFLINGVLKNDWFEAFMFAVAVAVGLTPEMLPMIVTVNLAKGAMSMVKQKVIVKRLNSIQNFGAMDVLCTDKTGTLTQDRVVLERYIGLDGESSEHVLKYAYLNSFYQTGLKNLLDVAILNRVEMNGELGIEKNYRKIDEIPFDFIRRRMSVVVEHKENNQQRHIMICKGAIEELFKICTHAKIGDRLLPVDDEKAARCFKMAQDLNDEGFRVIAVAYRGFPPERTAYAIADENALTLLGFVAFLDPPKETAAQAIKALSQHGVTVKVLTGDNATVSRKTCQYVGIAVDEILSGHEIEAMSDAELESRVGSVHVYAKLTPADKERIVQALRRQNHVVGFLGDGINDAPALRAADVGISVDNAVDVAKESADIILLEKNLLVLEAGVIEGRKVFGNIVKYIKMGASSNFGNVFSVLGASILLPFLPMLPVQLLTQNLLYDISQTGIPFDNVDKAYLEKPRRWEIKNIERFMLCMGPISSIFDYATFALMWFFFHANSIAHESLFQSGWFIEGLLSQTIVVHVIRTQKIPFLQSWPSVPFLVMSGLVVATGIVLPYTAVGASIGLMGLPWNYFPILLIILVLYCILAQKTKMWFFRRFESI